MRVVRLEKKISSKDIWGSLTRTLRDDRLGAFQNMIDLPAGLGSFIPSPYEDPEFCREYDHSSMMFFAFPSFDFFVDKVLEKFPYCVQFLPDDWGQRVGYHPGLVLAEYEVEPVYKSDYQVIFYGSTATFISEIKLSELCSDLD